MRVKLEFHTGETGVSCEGTVDWSKSSSREVLLEDDETSEEEL